MKKINLLLFLVIIAFGSLGCQKVNHQNLSLTLKDSVVYQTENTEKFFVKYYALSDNSYDFVEVFFPDGQKYTLVQQISASGAKYGNNLVIWWAKGNSAFIELRNEQGGWDIKYRCQAVEKE